MPQYRRQIFPMPKKPMAAPGTKIVSENQPIVVVTGPVRGGYIQNPFMAPGLLLVDIVNTPGNGSHGTTLELMPGERFDVPQLQPGVQVKATSGFSGHQFTAVIW